MEMEGLLGSQSSLIVSSRPMGVYASQEVESVPEDDSQSCPLASTCLYIHMN